ncbi:MAG: nitrate- and nitrite sensing domain-containing protein, partial [Gallionellaceae bacterium]
MNYIREFIHRWPVGKKINLLFGLPLLAFLALVTMSVSRSVVELRHLGKTAQAAETVRMGNALIHVLQVERGLSASLLAGKSETMVNKLRTHHQVVDKELRAFEDSARALLVGADDAEFEHAVSAILRRLPGLPGIRQRVLSQRIALSNMLATYTSIVLDLRTLIVFFGSKAEQVRLSKISGLSSILNTLIEAAGIERAILANTFTFKRFQEGSLYAKAVGLASTQYQQRLVFISNASQVYKNTMSSIRSSANTRDVLSMRRLALGFFDRQIFAVHTLEAIGYGGLIHTFKNYVVRGREKDKTRFEEKYADFVAALEALAALPHISSIDKEDISALRSTLSRYKEAVPLVEGGHRAGVAISALD